MASAAISLKIGSKCEVPSPDEYAISYLKTVLEKRGPTPVFNLVGDVGNAPLGIRNTIGGAHASAISAFVKKHSAKLYL